MIAALLAACRAANVEPITSAHLREIPSPAGPSSAQPNLAVAGSEGSDEVAMMYTSPLNIPSNTKPASETLIAAASQRMCS
jgi:hypothetical protein